MTSKKNSAVEPAPQSAVALTADIMKADAGAGAEEITSKDLAVPYLSIVQKISGYVEPTHKAYNKDARPGDFINTVTGRVYDGEEGIVVVPCHFRSCYVEQKPGKMGAFVAEHHALSGIEGGAIRQDVDGTPTDVLPNGNHLVYTARMYVFIPSTREPCIVTMRSKAIKTAKKWNGALTARTMTDSSGEVFQPPLYSALSHLSTCIDSTEKGSWSALAVNPIIGEVVDLAIYNMAKDFEEMVYGG